MIKLHSNQSVSHARECGGEQCLVKTRIGDECSCQCHNHNHTTLQCNGVDCPAWRFLNK